MIKMQLEGGDGTVSQIHPDDERYAVLQRNARTAFHSMLAFVFLRLFTALTVIAVIAALVGHSMPLVIMLVVCVGMVIVLSRISARYRRKVRDNARAWREHFGTWQQPQR